MKICKSCVSSVFNPEENDWFCKEFFDIVNGAIMKCRDCRHDGGLCGIEGKKWAAITTENAKKLADRITAGELKAHFDSISTPKKRRIDTDLEKDIAMLKLSLEAVSKEFDRFVGACLDDAGNSVAPDRAAVMRARSCLPPYCAHAFKRE